MANFFDQFDAPGPAPAAQSAANPFDRFDVAATPPDKYHQAAIENYERARAAGVPQGSGYADRFLHGATLGFDSDLAAAALTPPEMIRHGTLDPREGFHYARANEDVAHEKTRERTGALGTAAELAGGLATGGALARGGVTLARQGAGWLRNAMGLGAEGAGYGAVTGFNEGGDIGERLTHAAKGAGTGTVVGGVALPVAGTVISHTLAPLVSGARALVNPGGVAESQFARAMADSGHSASDVGNAIAQAAREGQGEFTAADAMGHSGQRLLSTVAGAPGPGRQAAVDFLDQRQAGQGRRVSNILSEGFQTPETAAQTRTRLETARDTAADRAYGQVRNDAGPVDVSNVLRRIDATVAPEVNQFVNPRAGLAPDSVEAALQSVRSRLSDGRSQLTDFNSLQRVRGDLADAISRAQRAGEGNKVRLLSQVRAEMDAAMENASGGFRAANADYARRSRAVDAIDTGSNAAQRGRTEDTIPAFRAMMPREQDAFRSGYVEPLIAQTQGAVMGVNKARPFTSDAYRDEFQAMAPLATGNPMMNRLGRENTMFSTRNTALGGSRTAENLEDNAAQRVDPSVLMALFTGHPLAAAGNLARGVANNLTGYTPAVRDRLAQLLLMRGANPQAQAVMTRVEADLARKRAITAAALRGILAGSGQTTAANLSR